MSKGTGTLHSSSGDDSSNIPSSYPAQYVVVALNREQLDTPLARFSLKAVTEVVLYRGEGGRIVGTREGKTLHLQIPDYTLSSTHARLQRHDDAWVLIDLMSRNGTFINGERVERERLTDGCVFDVGNTHIIFRDSELPVGHRADLITDLPGAAPADHPAFLTLHPMLRREFKRLAKVAASTTSVLIGGETGTGKEVVARAVHDLSGRTGHHVAVNCGAIPAQLIESELFGSVRGAYSGAIAERPGLIRTAHGGTLFLDEVAELPEAAQAALLRVLQEREVRPVGGTEARPVDIRLIAATHQDLQARVEAGTFRHDLLMRLQGYALALPPLRERREDLGLIAARILERHRAGVKIARRVSRASFDYEWPGNIRELEQALTTALAQADGDTVGVHHFAHMPELDALIEKPQPAPERRILAAASSDVPVVERSAPPILPTPSAEHVRRVLLASGGNIVEAARVFGRTRGEMRGLIRRFELDIDELMAVPHPVEAE